MNDDQTTHEGNAEATLLSYFRHLLQGLGEIERNLDGQERVRLPSEYGRLRGDSWLHRCVEAGVIEVFPELLCTRFLRDKRPRFKPRDVPVSCESSTLAMLRPLAFQKAGNGWRCGLYHGVLAQAGLGAGDVVWIRAIDWWWEVWSCEYREKWLAAFHGT